jgi:hypothetical protein
VGREPIDLPTVLIELEAADATAARKAESEP